jgi:hypothetical protein
VDINSHCSAGLPKRKRRLIRILVVFSSAVAIVSIVSVAIQIQQNRLRRRAEQLLIDLQSLQVRRTTLAEAQHVLQGFENATQRGIDSSGRCELIIVLQDVAYEHPDLFSHAMLRHIYMLLGGHPAVVRAALGFRDGVFLYQSIGVYIEVAPYRDAGMSVSGYTLIAGASIVPELDKTQRNAAHPAYALQVGGGCTGCLRVGVTLTADASPLDIDRLTRFDLTCLTRWRLPCRTQEDIMPAVCGKVSKNINAKF